MQRARRYEKGKQGEAESDGCAEEGDGDAAGRRILARGHEEGRGVGGRVHRWPPRRARAPTGLRRRQRGPRLPRQQAPSRTLPRNHGPYLLHLKYELAAFCVFFYKKMVLHLLFSISSFFGD